MSAEELPGAPEVVVEPVVSTPLVSLSFPVISFSACALNFAM